MKRISVFALVTLLWTAVVVSCLGLAVFQWPQFEAKQFIALIPASFLTCIVVWYFFRKRLIWPKVTRDWSLPFLTVGVAGPVWSVFSYLVAWSLQGFTRTERSFDGFGGALISSLVVGLGFGLFMTYPAAYVTQIIFGFSAKRRT